MLETNATLKITVFLYTMGVFIVSTYSITYHMHCLVYSCDRSWAYEKSYFLMVRILLIIGPLTFLLFKLD